MASQFAQLITQYRQQRGMSQGQLAQATRLSRTYVYHLEKGMRGHPSPRVAGNIVRALQLHGEDVRQFAEAYTQLTGHYLDNEQNESTPLDFGDMARLLVRNTSYPAHSLDRLWQHLLVLIFESQRRWHFHGWENLARRLVSDFQYNTRTLTHLSEYKELWKYLRTLPEFRRIAAATYAEARPEPSFVFQVQHSELGRLTLRTATTVFTGIANYSMVSYVPGDMQTLEIYRKNQRQRE